MAGALTLAGELTIYTVGELRESWSAWLATLDPAEARAQADGGAVAEVDGAGAQLLLALARSCAARGQPLVVEPCSATLAAACEVLGLGAMLAGEPAGAPQ